MSKYPKDLDWAKFMDEEKHRSYAHKVFNKLRLELAVRRNNEHVGTGLGGNASQFLFLIGRQITFQKPIDEQPHFLEGKDGEIIFQVPKHCDMKAVRKALDSFYDTHPQKNNFTEEQITNPSFLRDYIFSSNNNEMKLLVRALDVVHELVPWLDDKCTAAAEVNKVFSKEIAVFEAAFLKEMGLPADYFDRSDPDDFDPIAYNERMERAEMHKVCENHPVWGAKISAVNKRRAQFVELIVSPEDMEKLNIISSFPKHITLFVIRSCIGIERMVALELDERMKALASINKAVDEDCGE